MKNSFILLAIVGFLSYIILTSNSSGAGLGGAMERTGISGTTGCTVGGCHGNTAGITVAVSLLSGTTPVTSYTPGASYTVRLAGTYTASTTTAILSKFGFQIGCAVGSTATNAGTWGTPPTGTHAATVAGINIIEQGSAITATTGGGSSGSTYVVNIPWTAPVAGTGTVNFKSVLNAVNANSSADAIDRWSAGTLTVTEATSTTPPGPITGVLTVCVGSTITLSDATPGGTWSSSSTAVATVGSSTGIVTGVATGIAIISYSTGTGAPATAAVTVNPAPTPVTGTPTVCVGATTTLNSTPVGGTWNSGTTSVATIGSTSGIVTGVSAGTTSITYVVFGCNVTKEVTVNAAGASPIAGSHTVCVGTTTTLTNLTTGGTWTSSVPAKATVGSATGIVTGVSVGTTMISYTATNSCGSSTVTHSINVLVATACTGGMNPTTTTENYLSVFPNPSNGTFTMNLVSTVSETATVRVVNLSGQVVKEFTAMTNAALEVSIPRTTGMYFVMVNTPSGNYVSKLIVQ